MSTRCTRFIHGMPTADATSQPMPTTKPWPVPFFAAAVTLASLLACSADEPGAAEGDLATCQAHAEPKAKPANYMRQVSFSKEVLPVFQASCAFASCHGSQNLNGIFLGARSSPTKIREALLAQPPKSTGAMPYVTPSDPERSYLLRKLDGNFCDITCTDGRCGERMPKGGDPIATEERQLVADWIAAGAPDN
jgi:hypothetical protein